MHHLALTQLTMCKLMSGIMHEILNKSFFCFLFFSMRGLPQSVASLRNYISIYLPENANNVEQRIRIFTIVVMLLSPMLSLITFANNN